ncbi:MAG: ATP-dependent DNA helicase RecG [Alphaproteobacteria bacterium]|nr:ATP-dependent DNA helicase RecG [Alphaproteobacteria bacterium]
MLHPGLDYLSQPLSSIKGVGPKLSSHLQRLVGHTVWDLLCHVPVDVIDRRHMPALHQAQDGDYITTIVMIDAHQAPVKGARKIPYKVHCSNETGVLTLVFFHYHLQYIQKQLQKGKRYVVSGKVERFHGGLNMPHPECMVPETGLDSVCRIEPIYPLTSGLSNKHVLGALKYILPHVPPLPEWIDPIICKANHWPSWNEALVRLHNPTSPKDLDLKSPLRERLAYDELLSFQLALAISRRFKRLPVGQPMQGKGQLVEQALSRFGFELTSGQQQVLREIKEDQISSTRMMRLLQGDVGSGKTVVALLSMLGAIEAGKQAALMVPTEILAKQHAASITALVSALGVEVALLTGSTKTKERRAILARLEKNEIQLLVGTHALFQEQVNFADLGMVVIDEQHRFGVKQRMALADKGDKVDVLLMTATPIPRTLAMTAYGDMEISSLHGKPAGRQPIKTSLIPLGRIGEVALGLRRVFEKKQRVYWICPLVDESELVDLSAAVERFQTLEQCYGQRVGLVHGKMKAQERDSVMKKFKEGEIDCLVSTTVVEVGVDVPEATVMVIEHAERFGLAQLHQLRGRVGRGKDASSCILLYHEPLSQISQARLEIMRQTEDGFRIAEEDLRLRGAGEILGTKQSGLPDLVFADFNVHYKLLLSARDDARYTLEQDPNLTSTRGVALKQLLWLFDYGYMVEDQEAGRLCPV